MCLRWLKFFFISFALVASPAMAQKRAKKQAHGPLHKKKSKRDSSADRVLNKIKQKYISKEISRATFWAALQRLDKHENKMSSASLADKLQLQSELLLNDDYPVAAALTAIEALRKSKRPFSGAMTRAWQTLRTTAKDHAIQSLLEEAVLDIHQKNAVAPVLGNDWYYFVGNAYARRGKLEQAWRSYKKLRMNDRYFFPGKYQQALVLVRTNELSQAESVLKMLTHRSAQAAAGLSKEEVLAIGDYARLALGRILYEQKRFKEAALHYREVSRESVNFYDALFEQSWALFMAGYPNHALGALHSVESPFFKHVYNPESTMLQSMVYYWMCRYDDSRNALAQFSDDYSRTMESLADFLDRKRLNSQVAYRLFEDLISGVSQASLGMSKAVLNRAAESDGMLLLREEYASALSELERMDARGVLRIQRNIQQTSRPLRQYVKKIKAKIGDQLISEMKIMKSEFDRLYDQAQFLYLELMMSEKEQLLGRSLHASSKLNKVSLRRNISVWSKDVQSWAADDKDEYWWDEIGYHIFREPSLCSAN